MESISSDTLHLSKVEGTCIFPLRHALPRCVPPLNPEMSQKRGKKKRCEAKAKEEEEEEAIFSSLFFSSPFLRSCIYSTQSGAETYALLQCKNAWRTVLIFLLHSV